MKPALRPVISPLRVLVALAMIIVSFLSYLNCPPPLSQIELIFAASPSPPPSLWYTVPAWAPHAIPMVEGPDDFLSSQACPAQQISEWGLRCCHCIACHG